PLDANLGRSPLLISLVILSGASAPLLFRRVLCGGRTRSRRACPELAEGTCGCPGACPELVEGSRDVRDPGEEGAFTLGEPSDPRPSVSVHSINRCSPEYLPSPDPRETWATRRQAAFGTTPSARWVWWRLNRSGREEIASSK